MGCPELQFPLEDVDFESAFHIAMDLLVHDHVICGEIGLKILICAGSICG